MNIDHDHPLIRQSRTVNPYRMAASYFYRRFMWDLNIESWKSRKKIKNLKGQYEGEKAVILCNGPSLLDVDFSLLDGAYTFGLNKINLLFDKNNYRPSSIVSVNHLVIEQNADFFNKTSIPLFIDSKGVKHVNSRDNICFLPVTQNRIFAKDCSMNVYHGYTVTFVALQLAFHMGFSKVALVGCDHNFATKGPANKEVTSGEKDESHFDPNYFSGGAKWDLPDLFESEISYTMAKNMYEAYGRILVNCTQGGLLEILDRASLGAFIGDS